MNKSDLLKDIIASNITSREHVKRLFACINACANIKTEDLEADCLGKLAAAARGALAYVSGKPTKFSERDIGAVKSVLESALSKFEGVK